MVIAIQTAYESLSLRSVLTVLTTRFATVAKFPSVSFAPDRHPKKSVTFGDPGLSRSLAENCFQNSANASEIYILSELQLDIIW